MADPDTLREVAAAVRETAEEWHGETGTLGTTMAAMLADLARNLDAKAAEEEADRAEFESAPPPETQEDS